MNSPAIGIGYSLWLRTRWALGGVLAVLLVVAVGGELFPSEYWMCGLVALPMVVMAYLLNVFTYGPVDLGVQRSAFPSYMLALPAQTGSLVGWSMLYGAVTHALIWMLMALLMRRATGGEVPVIWPAVVLAAATVWVQAVSWSSFPSPFARIPVLAAVLVPLFLLALLAGWAKDVWNVQSVGWIVAGGSAMWALAAYAFGVRGLARTRRGDGSDWIHWLTNRVMTLAPLRRFSGEHVRPAFHSAVAAQLWHEIHRNGKNLPAMYGFVALPLLLVLVSGIMQSDTSASLMWGSTKLTPAQLGLVMLMYGPVFFGMQLSAGMGKLDIWGKLEMPSFFAVRPMTNLQFVLIKMAAAVIPVLATWAITLVLLAVWVAVEASPLNANDSLVRAAYANWTWKGLAIGSVALIGVVGLTWENITGGMWISLLGRKWIVFSIQMAFVSLVAGAAVAGLWIYHNPEIRTRLVTLMPWIVGGFLLLKLCSAVGVMMALRERCRIEPAVLARFTLGWVAVVGLLLAVVCYFTPPTWMLVAGIILFVPFAQLAAAPLALDWNRHR